MGGKGSSSDSGYSSQDAYNYGYDLKDGAVRLEGLEGLDPTMEGYDSIYEGYMDAHNAKVEQEKIKMMFEELGEDDETSEEYYARLWDEGGKSSATTSFDNIVGQLEALGDNQVYTMQPAQGGGEGEYEYEGSWYTWDAENEAQDATAWTKVEDSWGITDTNSEGFNWDTAKGYLSDGRSISEVVGERNSIISGYQDALGAATELVNSNVSSERANAALMGVEYDLSDESKAARISDQLANVWTDSNQAALDSAISNFGSGGFTQEIFRGTGTGEGASGAVGEEQGGTSIVAKPTLIDQEDQLGTGSILGG